MGLSSQIHFQNSIQGIYINKNLENVVFDSLILLNNHTFKFYYLRKKCMTIGSVEGYYCLNGDTLILNSTPQRYDIIIIPRPKKNNKKLDFKTYFKVRDEFRLPFSYSLFAITHDNDTLKFTNQFDMTVIEKQKIRSIYIIPDCGPKTSSVFLRRYANYFEVYVNTDRIMDGEKWIIRNNKIKYLNPYKEWSKHPLVKIKSFTEDN